MTRYFSLIIILLAFAITASAENSTALKLHKIFNKKLVKPLKLGKTRSNTFLQMLNSHSNLTVSFESSLTENSSYLKNVLSNKPTDKEKLNTLLLQRQLMTNEYNQKNDSFSSLSREFLGATKLAYFILLKDKLKERLKKSIDIGALTLEANATKSD